MRQVFRAYEAWRELKPAADEAVTLLKEEDRWPLSSKDIFIVQYL